MKSSVVSLVAVALIAACGGGTAGTQSTPSTPPGPVAKYRNSLPGLNSTGKIDLIQNVIDFAPGAASVVHTHSSPNIATVLQGQITVKVLAGDKQASAGEMLVEPINQPLQAVNTGSGEAMVVVAFTVPHGGKPTAPVAGRPAPATPNKTLSSFTFDSPAVSGPYSLVQQILGFAPGSQTPRHRVGGPGVITVLQGQIVVNTDGVESTFKAGESFTEMPGEALQVFNQAGSDVVLAATFALPDGAQLTTNL
jgi:quercetin dioxygenase-like cupin family protein